MPLVTGGDLEGGDDDEEEEEEEESTTKGDEGFDD